MAPDADAPEVGTSHGHDATPARPEPIAQEQLVVVAQHADQPARDAGVRTASRRRSARSSAARPCPSRCAPTSSTARRSGPAARNAAFRCGPPSSSSERMPRAGELASTQPGRGRSSGARTSSVPGGGLDRVVAPDDEDAARSSPANQRASVGDRARSPAIDDADRVRRIALRRAAARRGRRRRAARCRRRAASRLPLPTASKAAR